MRTPSLASSHLLKFFARNAIITSSRLPLKDRNFTALMTIGSISTKRDMVYNLLRLLCTTKALADGMWFSEARIHNDTCLWYLNWLYVCRFVRALTAKCPIYPCLLCGRSWKTVLELIKCVSRAFMRLFAGFRRFTCQQGGFCCQTSILFSA